jgi:DNA modification methylase
MQIIWAKSNFPIGRGDYHVRHEPCWYAVRDGKPAHRTDDRTQTTLWEINLDKNVDGGHSTQKPLECMERPIRNHTFVVIYDPFLGSGTTLIACERLGRKCRAVEISPGYCAVAIQRWVDMTGGNPVLLESSRNGEP